MSEKYMIDPEQDSKLLFDQMLKSTMEAYIGHFPEEAPRQAELIKQMSDPSLDLSSRTNIPEGHMCASGLVVSSALDEVLMVEHKALGIWVVPGGHYDLDDNQDLSQTALREIVEETGLSNLTLHPWHKRTGIPLDIDTHPIPKSEKKNEDGHQHFDYRYVFLIDKNKTTEVDHEIDLNEVLDIKWVPVCDISSDMSVAPAVAKLSKMLNEKSESTS